jgi:hypothetical protein
MIMELKIEVEVNNSPNLSIQKTIDLKATLDEYLKKDAFITQRAIAVPSGVAGGGLLDSILDIITDHPEVVTAILNVLVAMYKHFWGQEKNTSVKITLPSGTQPAQVIVINNAEQAEALKQQLVNKS